MDGTSEGRVLWYVGVGLVKVEGERGRNGAAPVDAGGRMRKSRCPTSATTWTTAVLIRGSVDVRDREIL